MKIISAKQRTTPGIIDTLSAGFEHINRIAWVALLPIILDLVLWKGPQFTIASFLREKIAEFNSQLMDQVSQGTGAVASADTVQMLAQLRQALEESQRQFNLLGLLGGNGPFTGILPGIPSLGLVESSGPATEIIRPLFIALWFGGLVLLGLFLGCIYLGLLGQQVRDGRIDLFQLAQVVWRYWLSAIGFLALMLGLLVAVAVPAALIFAVSYVVSPSLAIILAGVFGLILQVAAMLMVLYFFFVVDAIVISEVGPLRAVANSFKVVALGFLSAVGFILLVILISVGTEMIWRYVLDEPWGVIAGIVGNAYIVTGLTAARMLFYKNRMAAMEQAAVD